MFARRLTRSSPTLRSALQALGLQDASYTARALLRDLLRVGATDTTSSSSSSWSPGRTRSSGNSSAGLRLLLLLRRFPLLRPLHLRLRRPRQPALPSRLRASRSRSGDEPERKRWVSELQHTLCDSGTPAAHFLGYVSVFLIFIHIVPIIDLDFGGERWTGDSEDEGQILRGEEQAVPEGCPRHRRVHAVALGCRLQGQLQFYRLTSQIILLNIFQELLVLSRPGSSAEAGGAPSDHLVAVARKLPC